MHNGYRFAQMWAFEIVALTTLAGRTAVHVLRAMGHLPTVVRAAKRVTEVCDETRAGAIRKSVREKLLR